jgi:hypothetical protein
MGSAEKLYNPSWRINGNKVEAAAVVIQRCGDPTAKSTELRPDDWNWETDNKLKELPWLSKQSWSIATTGRPAEVRMTKTTVPIPKTGIDPDTPTTSTAQERRDRKASGHEHMLCPAPESTWKRIFKVEGWDNKLTVDDGDGQDGVATVQGWHRHSALVVPGTKVTAALTTVREILEGAVTEEG